MLGEVNFAKSKKLRRLLLCSKFNFGKVKIKTQINESYSILPLRSRPAVRRPPNTMRSGDVFVDSMSQPFFKAINCHFVELHHKRRCKSRQCVQSPRSFPSNEAK